MATGYAINTAVKLQVLSYRQVIVEGEFLRHIANLLTYMGTPRYVKQEQPGKLFEWECDSLQVASDLLKQKFGRGQVSIFGSRLHTVLDEPRTQIPQVKNWLQEAEIKVQNHREIQFSLEDVFISVVEQARQRGLDVSAD